MAFLERLGEGAKTVTNDLGIASIFERIRGRFFLLISAYISTEIEGFEQSIKLWSIHARVMPSEFVQTAMLQSTLHLELLAC